MAAFFFLNGGAEVILCDFFHFYEDHWSKRFLRQRIVSLHTCTLLQSLVCCLDWVWLWRAIAWCHSELWHHCTFFRLDVSHLEKSKFQQPMTILVQICVKIWKGKYNSVEKRCKTQNYIVWIYAASLDTVTNGNLIPYRLRKSSSSSDVGRASEARFQITWTKTP